MLPGDPRMSLSGLFVQLLNGLASASSLFLVSAGLSLIFGVMRIVNFAHGSFFMLGIYLACKNSLMSHCRQCRQTSGTGTPPISPT